MLDDVGRSPRDVLAAANNSRNANKGSRAYSLIEDDDNLDGACAQPEAIHRQAPHAVTGEGEGITTMAPSSTLATADRQESPVASAHKSHTRNGGTGGDRTLKSRDVSSSPRKTLSSTKAAARAGGPSVEAGDGGNNVGGRDENGIVTTEVSVWSPGDESTTSSAYRSKKSMGNDGNNLEVGVPVPTENGGQQGVDAVGCRSPIDQNQTKHEHPLLLPPPPPVLTGSAAGIHAWDPYETIRYVTYAAGTGCEKLFECITKIQKIGRIPCLKID